MLRLFAATAIACLSVSATADEPVEGWGAFTDPDGDCNVSESDGVVTIAVPGTPHDLSAELERMNAPRIVREVSGDFIVEVKTLGRPDPEESLIAERAAYQGSGLLLMKDGASYVRLERAAVVRPDDAVRYVNFEMRQERKLHPAHAARLNEDGDLYLRLERRGKHVLGAVSQDRLRWVYLEPFEIDLGEQVQVGVAAVNGTSRSFDARFKELQVFEPTKPQPEASER